MTSTSISSRKIRPVQGAGAIVLTIGGLAAAFGVASCCALPLLLAGMGIGSAWLFKFAVLAAPHRALLLTTGIGALAGAAVLLWKQSSLACSPTMWCVRPLARHMTLAGLIFGMLLLIAGYLYV